MAMANNNNNNNNNNVKKRKRPSRINVDSGFHVHAWTPHSKGFYIFLYSYLTLGEIYNF